MRAAADRARVVEHLVHGHGQRVGVAENDHGQRVADQDAVDARVVHRAGGGEVVRGDERDRLALAVLVSKRQDGRLGPLVAGRLGGSRAHRTPLGARVGRTGGAFPIVAARRLPSAASRSTIGSRRRAKSGGHDVSHARRPKPGRRHGKSVACARRPSRPDSSEVNHERSHVPAAGRRAHRRAWCDGRPLHGHTPADGVHGRADRRRRDVRSGCPRRCARHARDRPARSRERGPAGARRPARRRQRVRPGRGRGRDASPGGAGPRPRSRSRPRAHRAGGHPVRPGRGRPAHPAGRERGLRRRRAPRRPVRSPREASGRVRARPWGSCGAWSTR